MADLKQKVSRLLIIIWCVTMGDDSTLTLRCSHKVNVKLHSAAALQQRAFKLIWLAVKPHAGTRARTHTQGTHANTCARGHRKTHTHMHAGLTRNTDKVSDIVTCTGEEEGGQKVGRARYLP